MLLQDSALLPEQSQGKPSKARFHLVRVQELQQLQMYQPAGQEIRSLAPLLPSTPAAQYFLASLYVNNQQHAAAFRALNSVMEALSPAEVRVATRFLDHTVSPGVLARSQPARPDEGPRPLSRPEHHPAGECL